MSSAKEKRSERRRKYDKERRERMKMVVFTYYGGTTPRCACCKEGEMQFLTINHVNEDGAERRRKLYNNNHKMHLYIIQNGFPDGYEVLCWNCNSSRGIHGTCH